MKVLALLIGVLIVGGLAWGGGELHYRSCVDAAEARNPVLIEKSGSIIGPEHTVKYLDVRRRAVDGCSRLP